MTQVVNKYADEIIENLIELIIEDGEKVNSETLNDQLQEVVFDDDYNNYPGYAMGFRKWAQEKLGNNEVDDVIAVWDLVEDKINNWDNN
jgi:hypothetical protein